MPGGHHSSRHRGSLTERTRRAAVGAAAPGYTGKDTRCQTVPGTVLTRLTSMIFHQYQLSCLSLFSYLVGDESTGRAVVVDPQRDVSQYLADAESAGLRIER